jgi:hypothetical protein
MWLHYIMRLPKINKKMLFVAAVVLLLIAVWWRFGKVEGQEEAPKRKLTHGDKVWWGRNHGWRRNATNQEQGGKCKTNADCLQGRKCMKQGGRSWCQDTDKLNTYQENQEKRNAHDAARSNDLGYKKGGKCSPGDSGTYKYELRHKNVSGKYECKTGWEDTGCTWGDGKSVESRQCRQTFQSQGAHDDIMKNNIKNYKSGGKCSPGDVKQYTYKIRELKNGKWSCPSGYKDTGCTIGDGTSEELQCRKKNQSQKDHDKAMESSSNYKKGGKCSPGSKLEYSFTVRERPDDKSKWACPDGFTDTGCTWSDGENVGKMQCRRKK